MEHANRITAAKDSTARVTCEYSHLLRMDFQSAWLEPAAEPRVPKSREPAGAS